jgi:putative oxidoreductase
MDLAMLLLRLVVGLLFVGHGTQKLFGWFGGHGVEGTAGFLFQLGYRPARTHAVAAGFSEAVGGALLALGLFTPLAAAAIVGVMVNAIASVHGTKGPWITEGGYEYCLVMIVGALAPAIGGAGSASLDHAMGWSGGGVGWGLFSLLLGVIGAGCVLATRETEEATAGAEADLQAQDRQDRQAHRRAA